MQMNRSATEWRKETKKGVRIASTTKAKGNFAVFPKRTQRFSSTPPILLITYLVLSREKHYNLAV